MNNSIRISFLQLAMLLLGCDSPLPRQPLAFKGQEPSENRIDRIPLPEGFERVPAPAGSFAAWLRSRALKPPGSAVHLYNGNKKSRQDVHYAVLDIDVGEKNLQQCADAVIRLRAEYLYARRRYADIHFNYTSGDRIDFLKWASGARPVVQGANVRWREREGADSSYANFREYLEQIFTYAGTASLSQELRPVTPFDSMRIGDVVIHGGSPGHAVIVVDRAVNRRTGRMLFMLAQSYMPAQEIHVLKNPSDPARSPWYDSALERDLMTPEWEFTTGELRRFED